MNNNIVKIAVPLSDLFKIRENIPIILSPTDTIEYRDRDFLVHVSPVELFHCDLEIIHYWTEREFAYIREIIRRYPSIQLISFHAASCYSTPLLRGTVFMPGGARYSEQQMKDYAGQNISQLRSLFGDTLTIALENNNYYATEAYDIVTQAHFLASIVRDNHIGFVYDIAHAHITSHNRSIDFITYQQNLPCEHMVQVHLSRHKIDRNGIAFDAHALAQEEQIRECIDCVHKFPVRFISVEYYNDPQKLAHCHTCIRKLLDG